MNGKPIELKDAMKTVENAYCRRMNVKISTLRIFRIAEAFKSGRMDQAEFINGLVDALEDERALIIENERIKYERRGVARSAEPEKRTVKTISRYNLQ